ncbi:MAG: FAD-dependent oxidoreductase [Candidatus Omnitrophota bacterium]
MKKEMSAGDGSACGGRYVIIGNSAGGIAAAEAIREYDNKSKITVISDEPYCNYSRPLISYLLGKKINREGLPYRSREFYKQNRIDLQLNKKATGLDLRNKNVLIGKEKIKFDKLLIAVGGTPFMPKIKGSNINGVFTFTKLADAERIEKYIKVNRAKQAVVIGGGLIGLKATEGLVELGIKVTIVELADRILSSTFDKKASGIIEGALEKIGCKLITNNTVEKFTNSQSRKVTGVILKDKKEIKCDMVIVAIGVRPNIELVRNTPIETNKGIIVDNFTQTNIKDIYAAGDCCELKDKNELIAIWPVAVRQGKIAGYNMALRPNSSREKSRDSGQAGTRRQYSGSLVMNSVELCGIPTISVGQTNPEGNGSQILEYFNKEKSVYKKIVLQNGRIVGVILVGDIEWAGIYTGLIKDRVNAESFKECLLRDDFGLISLPSDYRKHLVQEVSVII